MDPLGGPISGPELRFNRVTRADGTTWLAVFGEIDMTTGDEFRHTLVDVLHEPGLKHLQLDVAPLRFIDSNGVASLLNAKRTADEQGVLFGVVRAEGAIRNVLEMLGVYEVLAERGT